MVFTGFISGLYTHRSRAVDFQECQNWYPEITNPDAKNTTILCPTPGTTLFIDLGTGSPVRGEFTSSTGRTFACSSTKLFEVFYTNGSVTKAEIGTLDTYSGPVQMADNGVQLILVDGQFSYLFSLTNNSFTRLETPKQCSHVQFINGRFVVNKKDANQQNLFWSGIYDGATWNSLDFASTEGYADKLISMAKVNNQLWLFGELSTEVFYDTGDASQPYQRIQGAFFDNGTVAPFSPASTGNTVLWIGSNSQGQGIIWQANGYQPVRISNHAIEYILQSMPRTDDAIGYCYQQDGHAFYVCTFPTANRTLVYDMTTNFWHERSTYSNVQLKDNRHVGNCCCFAFNRNLVGSKDDGKILVLDKNAFTDNGNLIRRVRTTPHMHTENKRIFYKSLEIDMEKGVAVAHGQGDRPDIALQYSNDGGFNWSSELWRTSGRIGKFNTRVKWYNLGVSRDRLFRIIYTDPTPCTLINAFLDVEVEKK